MFESSCPSPVRVLSESPRRGRAMPVPRSSRAAAASRASRSPRDGSERPRAPARRAWAGPAPPRRGGIVTAPAATRPAAARRRRRAPDSGRPMDSGLGWCLGALGALRWCLPVRGGGPGPRARRDRRPARPTAGSDGMHSAGRQERRGCALRRRAGTSGPLAASLPPRRGSRVRRGAASARAPGAEPVQRGRVGWRRVALCVARPERTLPGLVGPGPWEAPAAFGASGVTVQRSPQAAAEAPSRAGRPSGHAALGCRAAASCGTALLRCPHSHRRPCRIVPS
jgi:hypothetical protein